MKNGVLHADPVWHTAMMREGSLQQFYQWIAPNTPVSLHETYSHLAMRLGARQRLALPSSRLLEQALPRPVVYSEYFSSLSRTTVVKARSYVAPESHSDSFAKPLESSNPPTVRRFAVLGAGFAGVAVAWHLLQHTSQQEPVSVHLIDQEGIGAGASGVSGGLLHPYSPKGKLLWQGEAGWRAALHLLQVAEGARQNKERGGERLEGGEESEQTLAWHRGLLRPATAVKHAVDFRQHAAGAADEEVTGGACRGAVCISGSSAVSLVPGLAEPVDGAALFIPQGITLHPQTYLESLWHACQQYAQEAVDKGCLGTAAVFHQRQVASLTEMDTGEYEALIVCLGAGAVRLSELAGKLPLKMIRGKVLEMQAPEERAAPSLLGSTWVAAQGEGKVLVGASKEEGNGNTCPHVSQEEEEGARQELVPKAAALYPPILEWQVAGCRAGVRAAPPRTSLGNIPIAGCLGDLLGVVVGRGSSTGFWIVGGLGSRGLIYHGMMGEEMARAVVRRDEGELTAVFRQWKAGGGGKGGQGRSGQRPRVRVRVRGEGKVSRRQRRVDAEADAGKGVTV